MKTPELRRKATAVGNSRWAAYAAASAASAFVAVNSAEANIHYSGPINHKFTDGEVATFPLDPKGGELEFVHRPHYYSTYTRDGGSALFFIGAPNGASADGFYNTCAFNPEEGSVSNLAKGQVISTRPLLPNGGLLATHGGYDCNGGARGQFLTPGYAFVGFKFNRGKGDQYGWARLQMKGSPDNDFKLVDYAYGDPGERVKAGQRNSASAPAAESLGALAFGAAGVLVWRKRRARMVAL